MSSADATVPLPRCLYMEVTNRCNLRCRACVQFRGMPEPPRDLTPEECQRIADPLEGLERVVLHGIGEPLLHAQLPKIILGFKARGAHVLFNSNGLLLTAEKAALLIDCALDELRLSMDAATPATYAAMRGTNAFAQLMANLSTLMRLKQRARLERPRVSVWMVGSRENISELPALIGLAARAGIAEVYLQRLVYPLDGPGYGLAERGRAVVDPEPQVQSLLAESSELSRRLGVTLNASGLNDPAQCLKLHTENEAPWRRCRRPWEVAYITAWGNALPCCIAPFATRDYASLIMGNALERNLADIWNGPRYREFRRRHQSADPPQNCRGCGVEWSL